MNANIVKKEINKFNSFLISSHINPEGDSIGSQLALASLLKRLGKDVIVLNESPVPHILRFMHGADGIAKKMPAGSNFQAAVILDCPDMTRIGNISQYVTRDKVIFNIDHHISN